MQIDVTAADHLLTTTRGVRRRLDFERPVPRALIEECVDVALQAPAGSASLCPHFIVLTDPDVRRRVGEVYRDAHHPYLDELEATERAAGPPEGIAALEREFRTLRWHTDAVPRAPVLVIVAVDGRHENAGQFEQASVFGCILPAAWSFMLALRARGLGAAWTTVHLQREAEVAKILSIPPDVSQAAMLPVGYYTGSDFRRASRPAAAERIHWDGWGSRGA